MKTDTMGRFWAKVDVRGSNDCWNWTAHTDQKGYGRFYIDRDRGHDRSHRACYRLTSGEIPSGMVVRHSCDNPTCVNPGHLLLGTVADNNRDRDQRNRQWNQAKTHCKHLHPLTGANLYVYPDGHRACRACARTKARQYRAKIRGGLINA